MKLIVARSSASGHFEREFEVEFVRSLGSADPGTRREITIKLPGKPPGVFDGELEISDKGASALIHKCRAGTDLLV